MVYQEPPSFSEMLIKRPIKRIIIHHTLTSDGLTVSWPAIRRYHVINNRWSDIGYHFGVEKVRGGVCEALIGRPLDRQGAHTKCLNEDSIGIALVGNFDDYRVPKAQYNVLLVRLLKPLMTYFNIPVEMVQGHREAYIVLKYEGVTGKCLRYNRKSCPGWNFSMKKLRQDLARMGFPIKDKRLYDLLNDFDDEVMRRRKVFW